MDKLTPEQIARHAYDAGFRGDGLTTAVAVALAESGGAHYGDNSFGLWQVNAEAANAISKDGTDFTPWVAYTNGSYRQFLDEARGAAKAVTSGGGKGAAGGGGDGGADGFAVDTDLLTAYVRSTRKVADGLAAVGTNHLRRVRSIADDSFGLIGKESGFAAALDNFGAALQRQVKGVGGNADTLASSTAKAARAYRDRDDEIAAHLNRIER